MLNDRFLPQFGFRSVCSGSLDSDVILFGCVQIEVRKHTAVCLSHCGPPSCTLKLAESRHKRHESQSARRRTIRAIVDGFPAVCFHSDSPTISDSISIQGIGLQLPEMHNVLYGKRILRGRMPQQSHVICALASRAQYKS